MNDSSNHRELLVWQAALALAGKVYEATANLPSDEHLGLARQLRGASAAVASRIAEGAAHNDRRAFVQELRKARASLAELETHLFIAQRHFATEAFAVALQDVSHVGYLLSALMRRLSEQRSMAHAFRSLPIDTGKRAQP